MSVEEPFIRAIVDSPGDETPRLVYADWLEERGDPRAPYLRAEHELPRRLPRVYADWEQAAGKVRFLAKQLDVVWCARVSRPPLGVCCEHVQIRDRGPVITAQDIERFEQKVGIILPHDYRAFLLNYNGGVVVQTGQWLTISLPNGRKFVRGSEDRGWAHRLARQLGGAVGSETGDRELAQFHSLAPPPETGEEGWLKRWCAFRDEHIAQFPHASYEREWLSRSLEIARSERFQEFPRGGYEGILLGGVAEPELGDLISYAYSYDYSVGFEPNLFMERPPDTRRSLADFLDLIHV
jgi:uncharacterized protein (TIGR02996 family)